jgi:uncharacterized Fe-S cluster-containing protein
MTTPSSIELPGLDCGVCGLPTCAEFAARLETRPELRKRCIYLGAETVALPRPDAAAAEELRFSPLPKRRMEPLAPKAPVKPWTDSLGREFDFVLHHFPEEPGPREIILPRNPLITRELEITKGDVLIGRPLGMSCGCPITHCGVVTDVDRRNGVITWCVTGPLRPRAEGFKDLGYYSAEAYEGLVRTSRCELKIGMRYFFQPERCMLQWRHSGLVNYISRLAGELQVRVEGLWIG